MPVVEIRVGRSPPPVLTGCGHRPSRFAVAFDSTDAARGDFPPATRGTTTPLAATRALLFALPPTPPQAARVPSAVVYNANRNAGISCIGWLPVWCARCV